MLSRKQHEQKGIVLPPQWHSDTQDLLKSVYKDQLNGRSFFIFGQTFSSEVYMGISLISRADQTTLPITYCISAEIDQKTDHAKLLENMIDSVGIFFDSYFSTREWDEYEALWSEHQFKSQKFYYQVTRQNIELTLKANQLLGD